MRACHRIAAQPFHESQEPGMAEAYGEMRTFESQPLPSGFRGERKAGEFARLSNWERR